MFSFSPVTILKAGILLFAADFLLLFFLPFHPAVSLAVVFVSSSVLYVLIARQLQNIDVPDRLIYGILIASVVLRLMFLFMKPVGSDDFYRYIWDGRVQSHGINPYRYAPNDPALNALHTDEIPSRVNHPDLQTVYFPLSLWTFYLSYELGGEAVWGYKLMLLAAELAAIAGLMLLVRKLQMPVKYVLLYALCPLPIVQFAIDAHLDGLGLPFLVFGIYFYTQKKNVLSAVMFGLSMSIKPVALVMLPVLFFYEKEWKTRILFLTLPAAALLIQFLPYLAGARVFDALFAFAKNWTFNGVIFESVNFLLDDNQRARLVCAGLLSCLLLALSLQSTMRVLDRLYYAVLLLFLFSPVVHPWYVNWLVVLLPLTRKWSGIVYAAAVSLTTYTTLTYILSGVWRQSALILALEYLPVIALMAWEGYGFFTNRGRETAVKTA